MLDCLCSTQRFLCYLNQYNGDDAPQDHLYSFEALRCITQSLSIKQSLGQDVPTSSGESGGSSGA